MSSNGLTNGNGEDAPQPVRGRARRLGFDISEYPSRSEGLLNRLISNRQNGTSRPKQAGIPLRIIVVGAGLGGLATSIALARRGHKVTVLEQAQKLGEVNGPRRPSRRTLAQPMSALMSVNGPCC